MSGVREYQETRALAGETAHQRFLADGVSLEHFPRLPLPPLKAQLRLVKGDILKRGDPKERWDLFLKWWDGSQTRTVEMALAESGLTFADVQFELCRGSIALEDEAPS